MGLFAGLSKRHSPLLGYKDFIDALRDTLYLLLNMDRIPKLLMTGPISPRPEPKMPIQAFGEPVSREKEKPNASQNEVLSPEREV